MVKVMAAEGVGRLLREEAGDDMDEDEYAEEESCVLFVAVGVAFGFCAPISNVVMFGFCLSCSSASSLAVCCASPLYTMMASRS